ncbi:IQ domain-containing protein E [Galemys pyrenaicus]|uniref:IQ domain-containing protein E n=1 Tax=Galemys pyrenaicus TaxID=202257 RepID=A0A8J6E0P8_GALPY|nr:IQ domain-containing protein E [Galemys pyrenaicus]
MTVRGKTSHCICLYLSLNPCTFKPGSLTQPLKSDLTLEHAWTNPPSCTPDYLTEALRMKRSNLRRSASNGHVPGTPVYREKEDMYDEIIELKKSLHTQKSDVDLMRTKLRRLEEENNRKDRQIEQLLDPSRGPDFVRTLAEKRPDTGWVINGLKQRILKLEQQCKDKDSTIKYGDAGRPCPQAHRKLFLFLLLCPGNAGAAMLTLHLGFSKLQTDMKTTNLEEMRIAMETYYEEIHRLQTLLASSETTGKKYDPLSGAMFRPHGLFVPRPPVEKKIGPKRQKKVSSALLSLSRSVQELTEENQSLKEDLDRVLSNSPTGSKIKGYVEWSKPRLLRRIAELEKKINSMESPKSHSEGVKSSALAHSASCSTVPRQPHNDRQEDTERLRGAVKSLRGERSALQTQLLEKDLEVKQLLQTKADLQKELESVKEGEKERREREEALREEIRTLTKKCQELEETRKNKKEGPVARTPEVQEEPQALQPHRNPSLQDSGPDTNEGGFSWPPSACSEGRRDAAARTLQTCWKAYKHRKKKAVLDERSPSPRVPSPLDQAEADPEQEEAITIIQSILRAHLARTRHSVVSKRTSTTASTEKRPVSATREGPSSPAFPAAAPGKEDNEASNWETMRGPATEEEVPKAWGAGSPTAPQPRPGELRPKADHSEPPGSASS